MSHGTCTSRKLNSLGAQEALVGLLACSLQEDARYSVDYKFLHRAREVACACGSSAGACACSSMGPSAYACSSSEGSPAIRVGLAIFAPSTSDQSAVTQPQGLPTRLHT
eukprot:673765-Pelagomonas_calceolata.AAC.1